MLDADITLLLSELTTEIRSTVGDRLAGLYLYGSLATGGYESGISDVDLLAATNGEISDDEFIRLEAMHADFERDRPEWDDRIEVAYLSVEALGNFKTCRSRLVVISPGDPLHVTDAGDDWLMNWHLVRNGGRTILGPDPSTFIAETTESEFVDSLRAHVLNSDDWLAKSRNGKAQSYVVFTMCRTLVAFDSGRHAAKREAAEWVQARYPQWAPLCRRALLWRNDPDAERCEDTESYGELLRFRSSVQDIARSHRP